MKPSRDYCTESSCFGANTCFQRKLLTLHAQLPSTKIALRMYVERANFTLRYMVASIANVNINQRYWTYDQVLNGSLPQTAPASYN